MSKTPRHYAHFGIQPVDYTWKFTKSPLDFFAGNVLKYVFRMRFKGQLDEDLEKALYYARRLRLPGDRNPVNWLQLDRALLKEDNLLQCEKAAVKAVFIYAEHRALDATNGVIRALMQIHGPEKAKKAAVEGEAPLGLLQK